jgi:hypothetical protein
MLALFGSIRAGADEAKLTALLKERLATLRQVQTEVKLGPSDRIEPVSSGKTEPRVAALMASGARRARGRSSARSSKRGVKVGQE